MNPPNERKAVSAAVDIEFARNESIVRGGMGNKDRYDRQLATDVLTREALRQWSFH